MSAPADVPEDWSVPITHNGHTRTVAEWAKVLGFTERSLRNKIRSVGVAVALSAAAVTRREAGRRGGWRWRRGY